MKSIFILGLLAALGCSKDNGSKNKGSDSDGAATSVVPGASSANAQPWTRSSNGQYLVTLDWVSGPKVSEFSQARLNFAKADQSKPNSVSIDKFEPFMPDMNHGTSVKDQVISGEPNQAQTVNVSGIYFIMGGKWEIRLKATVDGQTDNAVIPVNVP